MSTIEAWKEQGRQLERAGRTSQWAIADWIAAGEKQFQKKAYPEAQAIFGLSRQTLYNLVSTAQAFPISRRRETLSFRHHDEVRALAPEKQDALLDQAEKESLTVAALRKIVKRMDGIGANNETPLQAGLRRLAGIRNVNVHTLRDTILQDYLNSSAVQAEFERAGEQWKAAEFQEPDAPEIIADAPAPQPGPGQVVVAVDDLRDALKRVFKAIDPKHMPILQYAMLDFSESGEATLTATDMNCNLVTRLRVAAIESGTLFLPAKEVLGALKGIETSHVILEYVGENVGLTAGSFSVKFVVKGSHEFPSIETAPDEQAGTFDLASLNDLLKRVNYAVPNSEGWHTIPVAQLEIAKGQLRAVATDGHRIAVAHAPTSIADREPLLIPKDTSSLIRALDGEKVAFKESPTNYFFQTDTTTLVIRKSQAKFPAYQRMFGGHVTLELTVPTEQLRNALKRAATVVDEQEQSVSLIYRRGDHTLDVTYAREARSTTDPVEVLSVDQNPNYAPVETPGITLNVFFLTEFLEQCTREKVTIRFGDASYKPVCFANGEDYLCLIAPIDGQGAWKAVNPAAELAAAWASVQAAARQEAEYEADYVAEHWLPTVQETEPELVEQAA